MLRKLTSWILNPPILFWAGGVLFLLTFLTIPASVVVGIESLKLPSDQMFPGKEVGYLSAINWWPNFGIVLPFLIMCLGWLSFSISRTNERLVEKKMLFDLESRAYITDVESVHTAWFEVIHRGVLVWLLFAAIAFGYSWWECWNNSIGPIINDSSQGKELDWAIGALLDPNNVSPWGNIIFAAFAWTIQGIGASLALLLLPICVSYAIFLVLHSYRNSRFVLIPNCESVDNRRGFEIFEDTGTLILGNALIAYAALYLIILGNEYLRMPALTIWDMPLGPFSFLVSIDNESNVIALMLGLILVIILVVLVPCIALSIAARRSRDNYLEINNLGDSPCTATMVWWPLRWLKMNVILLAIALCVVALFAPSVAPYLLSIFAGALVAFMVWKIKNLFPQQPDT